MARLLLFGGKGGVGKTTTSSATAVWLADAGHRVLLVSSDPAHSTSDSLDVELGPVPVEVEGVPGLFGLEMDPRQNPNLLPKVGEAVNNMGGNMWFGGLGMMLDPSAKDEFDDVKSDIKTADMILPGLDEALAFDELAQAHGKPDVGRCCVRHGTNRPHPPFPFAARTDRGMVGTTAPFDAGFGRHTVNALRAKRERRHERRIRAGSAEGCSTYEGCSATRQPRRSPSSPYPSEWASTKPCEHTNPW